MRASLIAFTLLVAAGASAAPRRWALVIGEDQGLSGEETLRYARSDARRALATFQAVALVNPGAETQLIGADAAAVRAALASLAQRLRAQATPADCAFTWLPERKLFAIPLERDIAWGSPHHADLRVFQVAGADLVEQGAVTLPDVTGPAGYVRRGILTTEDAYAVAADRVTAARLSDLSAPVATAPLAP